MTTISAPAQTTVRDGLLRLALRADAVVSAAAGVLFLLAGGPLSTELGLESGVWRLLGAAFVGYGALVWLIAARPTISSRAAWAIVAGNWAWAVATVVELAAGWLPLTTAGTVVAVAVAVFTGVIGDLQFLGLRRLSR